MGDAVIAYFDQLTAANLMPHLLKQWRDVPRANEDAIAEYEAAGVDALLQAYLAMHPEAATDPNFAAALGAFCVAAPAFAEQQEATIALGAGQKTCGEYLAMVYGLLPGSFRIETTPTGKLTAMMRELYMSG